MGHLTTKTVDLDTDKLKAQAVEIGGALAGAAVHAKDWTAPKIQAFAEWLAPRLEHAYAEGIKAAAPAVEKAAGKAGPVIDTAHDKLVDELIPRLVTVFNEAAIKAGKVADEAAVAAQAQAAALAEAAEEAAAKKNHTAAKTFFVVAALAAAAAAGAAWYKSRTAVDPWAEPWEPTDPTGADSLQTRPHDRLADAVGDAADAVGEAAGTAVAKTREASHKAAEMAAEKAAELREVTEEKAAELREVAEEKASEAKEAVQETVRRVRKKAPETPPDE